MNKTQGMEVTRPVVKKLRREATLRCAVAVPGTTRMGSDPLLRLTTLVRLGRHEDAVLAAEEFLSTDPTHLSALELLAKSLWQTGRMQAVVDTTRRLIVVNPYEPGYHILQASALQCLGRYGEAACAYQRAGSAPGAQEALTELNCWQAGLVVDLMENDPVFRAHYAQNPVDACASRGFSFQGETPGQERWLVNGAKREGLYTRPS